MEQLVIHRDFAYADHDRGHLDIYAPGSAACAPVVVFIHGGALLYGDKSLVAHVGVRLAREGLITVAINHRFSPAVTHPRHAQDAADACRWVEQHIGEYGGDPARIALAGHSSGGYLAALLSVDARWLEAAGFDRTHLRALVSISGFHYVDRLAPSRPKQVWGEETEGWVDASPAHRASADAPPTLLLWADGDAEDRRQDGTDFGAVLEGLGVPTHTQEVAHRDHQSIFFLLGSEGDQATGAMTTFLAASLLQGEPR